MTTTIKRTDWNKDYVINLGEKDETMVACGVVGTVEEFKIEFEKRFPGIKINTLVEKPSDYIPLLDRLRKAETERLLAQQ